MELVKAKEIVSNNLSNISLDNELRKVLAITLPTFEKWLGKPVNGHLANALTKVLPQGYSVRIAPKDSVYESIIFMDSNRRAIKVGYSWTGKVFDPQMLENIKCKLDLWELPTMENFDAQYNELVEKTKELNKLIEKFDKMYWTSFNQSLGGRYI